MKPKGINASLIEKLLILGVVLSISITFGIYTYLSEFVKKQSDSASQSFQKAEASQKEIDDTTASYKWMQQNVDTVEKTNKIVAEASLYKYQDQVINDIESYAEKSGIYTASYIFTDIETTTPGTGSSGAPQASNSGTDPAAGAAPTGSASTGSAQPSDASSLKTATIQITFGGALSYNNFLTFIKRIEENVTRMQITTLNITPDQQTRGKYITADMTISVFLNKKT